MQAKTKKHSVSVIVPARNEKGNIESIAKRIPSLGNSTEIVFVEGDSQDGTPEEIERVKSKHPERKIKFLKQDGHGKADAVHKGMENAVGDIFMILDADMTVAPEDLKEFYDAITESDADLVMGSRFIYPMEKKAMRFLNRVGNKVFSIILSWLIGEKVKDTLCGTKVLFRETYKKLKGQNIDLLGLDPFGDFFFILGTARMGGKIIEIPVRYRERIYGTTQISRFKHGLYLLKMCAVAAWRIKIKQLSDK